MLGPVEHPLREYRRFLLKNPRLRYADFYAREVTAVTVSGEHPTLGLRGRSPETFLSEGEYVKQLLHRFHVRQDECCVDFGCGSLRTGQHLLRHLKANRYVGMDLVPTFYDQGLALLPSELVRSCRPQFLPITEDGIEAARRLRPSFVLCLQVMNHIPVSELRWFFANLSRLARPGCLFVVSFTEQASYSAYRVRSWAYPCSLVAAAARREGLTSRFQPRDFSAPLYPECTERTITLAVMELG